jgi:hypothetical protein
LTNAAAKASIGISKHRCLGLVTLMRKNRFLLGDSAGSSPAQPTRREFLQGATSVAAGLMATPLAKGQVAPALPTVALGPNRVTRLIAGGNPLYGFSHFNRLLDDFMRGYFSDERVVKFLLDCERAGINTWQSNYRDDARRQMPKIRDGGCKMHWICLADPWDFGGSGSSPKDMIAGALKCATEAAKVKPVGIAHHGVATDRHWVAGSLDLIKDFINRVHDLGFPAGVSTHNPDVIDAVETKGWPVDFYMGCFYRITRTQEEFQKEIGVEPVGETYLASDPGRMCRALRQAKLPCLGFKILAAGRKCQSPQEVRQAFEFAFKNLKSTDATIVGMCPRFKDEISENVRIVREVAA